MSILKLFNIFYWTYLILWFIIQTSFEPYLEPGGKNVPFVFFFKYLQNEKRHDFSLLWFYLLLILNLSPKFLTKILIGSRVIVILSEGYREIQKKMFFQIFYLFIYFLKQLFLQNISSIHYVEVVNKIFFHLKSDFLIGIWK